MNHVTCIAASCSCRQAERLKIDSTIVDTTRECCNNNQETLIFNLNDDCIENICRKLPITDQINFALTCQRFFNVMTIISKMKHVYENTNNFYNWSPDVIKNFLRVFGRQIKVLDIKYLPKQPILNDFSSFCRNVEKLNVYEGHLDTNSMILLMDNMESLKYLNLYYPGIDDDFLKYLKKFKYLKNLQITNNCRITGKHIELLNDLESLEIYQCYNLTSENFRNICENLKNLRHLDIMHCNVLKPGDCQLILKNLLQLEGLKLSCFHDDVNCLPELPNLKKLGIQKYVDNEYFLKNLARLKGNQLEQLNLQIGKINEEVISALSEFKNLKSLHINGSDISDAILVIVTKMAELEELKLSFCESVTDSAVLEILEKCLKLKLLDLERCDSLTPVLLKDMRKLLEKQHSERLRKDRLVFTGTCSTYNSFMRNVHRANYFPDFIKIIFEEDNGGMHVCLDQESEDEYDHIWE